MKKIILPLVISLLCISTQFVRAQDEKPKVVLVLSGGGAKGIAHIPVLQALDSMGIVPDLVIGTSMGSIVGGLYAMGYSGDSIAGIVKTVDWNVILGGDISLKDVGMEEKSEFKKYLIDLDLIKGKPKINSALLKDQKLREFISELTYPAFDIQDFDDLPIPYRAMTTDIVNGKEVLLGEGSLGLAMRASMSIPGVFQPIPYENTLLVDGGILNNFPVDVAVEMGADIIIGSDVGGGMAEKEKLDNIMTLLFQASMLTSNLKNPAHRERCDVLFDHMPNLTYSTGDFNKGNLIYEEGKIATQKNIDKLKEIADQLKGFKQREHKIPDVENAFVLDTLIFNNISEANIELVRARTDIEEHKEYSVEELIAGVDRAMGTNLFSQITYEGFTYDDKLGLQLNGFEHSNHQVKGSLHYDTYRGVGLVINYTGRNVMGKASRFLATLDIAEQPKFRLQYQKLFGEYKNWWWRSEVLGEQLKQQLFLEGELASGMRHNIFQFDNQVNFNINPRSSFAGLGIIYTHTRVKPLVDADVDDNIINLENYYFNNVEIYAQYVFNDMNMVFYPTRGTIFKAFLSRSLYNSMDVKYSDIEEDPDVIGSTNGFSKIGANFEKRWSFSDKISGILGAKANFIFQDAMKSGDESFTDYGFAAKYFLGGNLLNSRKNSFPFPGLKEDELNVDQFMMLNLAIQFNPFGKIYLTPHYDIASVGFDDFSTYIDDAFSPSGNWDEMLETSLLMSAGATISYHSFLGPVNFDVSWVNSIDKVRLFFSVGLFF